MAVAEDGFSIPELKWRELLFVGALKPEGGAYVRDPSRPLPPFRIADLFPVGVRFVTRKQGGRIVVRRVLGPTEFDAGTGGSRVL